MSATTIRLYKEVRMMAEPWALLLFFALLQLLRPLTASSLPGAEAFGVVLSMIGRIGFPLAVAMVAGVSLGNELQYGTLSLLLGQPESRTRIWLEKMAVLVAAMLSAGALYLYCGWRADFIEPILVVLLAMAMIAVVCSSVFWSLHARSTIGSGALNLAAQFTMAFVFLSFVTDFEGLSPSDAAVRNTLIAAAVVEAIYSVVTLWLGKRRFERFQVSGTAGENVLTSDDRWMPSALSRALRSRPTGALGNLIRKEFRLQAGAWIMSAPLAASWIFGLLLNTERGASLSAKYQYIELASGILVGGFTMLIAVLAGCIPMGEEANLKTHTMMMTQPVSARRQWLVKFSVAIFTSLMCAVVIPYVAAETAAAVFGLRPPLRGETWILVGALPLACTVAFACASALRHTVGAALAMFPAMFVSGFAFLVGENGGVFVRDRILHVRTLLVDSVIATYHLNPSSAGELPSVLFWFASLGGVAILLGWRMFRGHTGSPLRSIGSFMLWMAAAALMVSMTTAVAGADILGMSTRWRDSAWQPLREANQSVSALGVRLKAADAQHPLQLAPEELKLTSPLTKRWLQGSTVTIVNNNGLLEALVQFPSGLTCRTGAGVAGRAWFYNPVCWQGTR